MSVPRAAEQLADRPGKSTVCFSVYDVARGGSPKVTCCSDEGDRQTGAGRNRRRWIRVPDR